MANNKVTDTNPPNAIVPPKLETRNTKNPKNKNNRSIEHTHTSLTEGRINRLFHPPLVSL